MGKSYTYRVIWSQKDQKFVGLCNEFPSLSHLDPDDAKALKGIKNLVTSVGKEMDADPR